MSGLSQQPTIKSSILSSEALVVELRYMDRVDFSGIPDDFNVVNSNSADLNISSSWSSGINIVWQ